MRIIPFFIFSLLVLAGCTAQSKVSSKQLYNTYEQYKDQSISQRRFKIEDIEPAILRLGAPFEVTQLGQSIEGRPIYQVKVGSGKTKVLAWSQMHGDEPTATGALLDIFNFFSQKDELDSFRKMLLNNITLYFIPMLNPDGAARFQRRNALNVDINRDALRLQSPESQILKRVRDELQADWGFNLHDQGRYYGAGRNPKTATISFLAPAYNYPKDINTVRGNSMKLIGQMKNILQQYIPGKVARYNDDFEPRAFGDNIQKWGTSTILIEAGGLVGDPEKQEIRKLHFVTLLKAFESIATKSYEKQTFASYESLPFNVYNLLHELIIRNATVDLNGSPYTLDIAYRIEEININDYTEFYPRAYISDLGDLSTFYGYQELDASGYQVEPGKTYRQAFQNIKQVGRLDPVSLLKDGVTDILLEAIPEGQKYHELPLRFVNPQKRRANNVRYGANPSLVLKQNGVVHYAVVNGQLFDVRKSGQRILENWGRLQKR